MKILVEFVCTVCFQRVTAPILFVNGVYALPTMRCIGRADGVDPKPHIANLMCEVASPPRFVNDEPPVEEKRIIHA